MNGSQHMEKVVQYKDSPIIEATKRLNMAYLLLKNPKMIQIIQEKGAYFFHGTNANALPNILKYGLNSVDRSTENNIQVNTGEKWSRINGKRKFLSLTDNLETALPYTTLGTEDQNPENSLLNFGVIIGTSLENMQGLTTIHVISDMPEIGISGNLPVDNIKFLAVPEGKVEFVKKLVGTKDIKVISMNMRDDFFLSYMKRKNELLERGESENQQDYPTYSKNDIKPVVKERRTSKIKEIFNKLKEKLHMNNRQTDEKSINDRG